MTYINYDDIIPTSDLGRLVFGTITYQTPVQLYNNLVRNYRKVFCNKKLSLEVASLYLKMDSEEALEFVNNMIEGRYAEMLDAYAKVFLICDHVHVGEYLKVGSS